MKNGTIRWLLALAFLLALILGAVIGALAFLPAAYLTDTVQRASRGQWVALDSQGSVWHGRARWAVRSGGQTETPRMAALPGDLAWQVTDIDFLPPRIHMKFGGEAIVQQRFSVIAGFRGVQVTPGALHVPAGLLEAVGAPFNTLKPGGQVWVSWNDWQFSPKGWQGQLTAEWREARSAVTRVAPFGSYRLTLNAQDQAAQFQVSSLSGPLLVEGQGGWTAGRWEFNGLARAEPAQREALASLMTLLGRAQPDGSVQLSMGQQ